jgi:O-methyltransferase
MNPFLRLLKSLLKKIDYSLYKNQPFNFDHEYPEGTDFEKHAFEICQKYSMTDHMRIFALIKSIEFIKQNKVNGDFVECGVWRGGNLILFQKFIEKYSLEKKIYAYDTFEGMSEPDEIDKTFNGQSSSKLLKKLYDKGVDRKKNILIADCSIEEVQKNFQKYSNKKNLFCVKGMVEKTLEIEDNLPNKISILRLDTDWYSSTKKELEILFPLLEKNGILIIDDYGYWKGARKAVDEYFKDKKVTMFKIDFTGRMIINSP